MPERKKAVKLKEVFTTYDAARICNANIASIKNWIQKGLLRAFRTPGGHYRIKRRDLELFLKKYNMPYPFQEKAEKQVFLVSRDSTLASEVEKGLSGHLVKSCGDVLEAALCVGLDRPDILAIDLASVSEGLGLLELLSGCADTRNIQFILVVSSKSSPPAVELRKRWNLEDLVDRNQGSAALVKSLVRLV
ncbi:MAG: helix-turn-helix domain-containing protein [Deltaproteobacteria bacterium]|nr:helix-turn-helix domain-containing protein [Deltaproteobacteria bacterium]